ncbi:MAG: hypothetical protein AAGC86_10025 [Pseudomonadota bacterium]
MLDHLSSQSEIAVRRGAARTVPPKRRRMRAPGTFVGVDLVIGWDGPVSELVQALRHTGLERLFTLRSVARGTQFVWRDGEGEGSGGATSLTGSGPWRVRFDATPEAGNRAEAHLPRLLESVGSRMTWQQVEKRHHVPFAAQEELGVGRGDIRWKGDAA